MTLPNEMRVVVERLPAEAQSMVRLEYKRRKKSKTFAYFAWFFLGFHYLYLRRVGLQAAFWMSWVLSLGVIGFIWWLVDLFRVSGMVDRLNEDAARDLIVQYKSIYGEGLSNASPTMVNVYSSTGSFPQAPSHSAPQGLLPDEAVPSNGVTGDPQATESAATVFQSGSPPFVAEAAEVPISLAAPVYAPTSRDGGATADIVASLREFGLGKATLLFGGVLVLGLAGSFLALKFLAPKVGGGGGQGEAVVSTEQLNCRSEPNPNAAIIDRFTRGTRVKVEEVASGWTKVGFKSVSCWVNSAYIQLGNDAASQVEIPIGYALDKTDGEFPEIPAHYPFAKQELIRRGLKIELPDSANRKNQSSDANCSEYYNADSQLEKDCIVLFLKTDKEGWQRYVEVNTDETGQTVLSIGYASINQHLPIPPPFAKDIPKLPNEYWRARKVLLDLGYTPAGSDSADVQVCTLLLQAGDASGDCGDEVSLPEAVSCSGTGVGFCALGWTAPDGRFLSITTTGGLDEYTSIQYMEW